MDNKQNYIVIGVDEVGRGCLAGPVVSGAYFFYPEAVKPDGLKDSKKLSSKQRQALLSPLENSGRIGIGEASHNEIDEINIREATFLAMRRALENLNIPFDERHNFEVIVDGNALPKDLFFDLGWGRVSCLVKADDKVPEVSSASVAAKEYRDQLMTKADDQFPGYFFKDNAGYGAPKHLAALAEHGFTSIHRQTFEPIKSMVKEFAQTTIQRPKL